MSVVSTVIIVTLPYNGDGSTEKNINLLNNWMIEHDFDKELLFQPISSDFSAGDKYPERLLFWGGFNYLDEDAFVDFFKTLTWNGTLLIIGSNDKDEGYRVVLGNGDDFDLSRINVEVPSITTKEGHKILEINEYDKESHLDHRIESDVYFESLEC